MSRGGPALCCAPRPAAHPAPRPRSKVALKKIKDTFRDLTDAKRILRELKLLRHLGGHENIVW